ncbi:alpha-L-rhamnosidase [Robiginitalea sediminis]|uniref:alpha-L-rhamnosidase n=1 Tax=Robiginitalea sediminis TaxID=1982593 RepID=UPI000B4AEE3B|nr:alpha-L-rhamnosidase [Robiginitalea sediminis]
MKTNRHFSHTRILVTLSALLLWAGVLSAQVSIANLQTEYLDHPMGLDVTTPRFSWQMQVDGDGRGYSQTAYRLVVREADAAAVWDSGKIGSSTSSLVAYGGEALKPRTTYSWEVTVWDQEGKQHQAQSGFETGLLDGDPDGPAWQGARWIGGGEEDLQLYSHYLSVFRMGVTLQLDQASKSTRAAFLLGANDTRLMDKDLNLQGVETGRDGHYLSFELDISGLDSNQPARIHVFRVGYDPGDSPDVPFKSFDVPETLIHAENAYDPHGVYLSAEFGIFQIFVDGQQEVNEVSKSDSESRFGPRGFNVNPVGSGNNFISFPMLADIGFHLRAGQSASFGPYEIRHFREPSNVLFSEDPASAETYSGLFARQHAQKLELTESGLLIRGGDTGMLLTADPSRNAAPMLRTRFTLESKPIARARVYATARGIYELHLNGERVGEGYFTPGLTQYNQHHQYQTYDVTDLLESGQPNALGAWLSEGWWSGNITYSGNNWNFFGDRQSLKALLVVTYADGSEQVVATEPDTWKLYTEGPLRYGSYFQGEVYDARLEAGIQGWSEPGYNASGWSSATEVPLEGTTYPGLSYDSLQLIGQIGTPPTVVRTLQAKTREEVRPGVFVYDMGQNMVGVPEIRIDNGVRGDTLVMRYAEVRYPDLPEYEGNSGMVMMENIRAALTQDLYILKGGPEVIRPRFTFHGYRFVELSGVDSAPPASAVQGLVISSIEKLDSHFETSNELVNRFWENITWSLRGNFLSIPTDTPARNERMGWSGDINVFSQAATYLASVASFLDRHLLAMRDIQREDGRFTDVAPVGGGFGGTLWGSAGIILPWEVYQQYGDTRILEKHYPAMVRYLDFLESRMDPETGILDEGPLGDWLSPEGSKNDNTLLWTAYHAYDLWIASQVAGILGKTAEAQAYAAKYAERKAFFNATYVDPQTHRTIHSGVAPRLFGPAPSGYQPPKPGDLVDTQASYAIPLNFGLFDPANQAGAEAHFRATVTRENRDDLGVMRPPYSLMTGFIGTASLNHALSGAGYHAEAYRLLRQEDYPSWLYPVINGATTIWERLNSYTLEDGFGGNNSMNSFNHYSFGAVASWMYNHVLGIQRDPSHPGFRHFGLHPTPDPDGVWQHAQGYYDSPYGRIESRWEYQEGVLVYQVRVPANTTAAFSLAASGPRAIREGGKRLNRVNGVSGVGLLDGRVHMTLASGAYTFTVAPD